MNTSCSYSEEVVVVVEEEDEEPETNIFVSSFNRIKEGSIELQITSIVVASIFALVIIVPIVVCFGRRCHKAYAERRELWIAARDLKKKNK